MKLSEKIRAAMAKHKSEYPDGDWRAVNEDLGMFFYSAWPILIEAGLDPYDGGNEGRADALEGLGY